MWHANRTQVRFTRSVSPAASRDRWPIRGYACFRWRSNHYKNALLEHYFPLVSLSWPATGHLYKATLAGDGTQQTGFVGPDEMWTDAFGCHGTSGSGVFLGGGSTFVNGNTVNGSFPGQLCESGTSPPQEGSATLSYVRPANVRVIEALSMVQNDR
jgi:hypothetical protein